MTAITSLAAARLLCIDCAHHTKDDRCAAAVIVDYVNGVDRYRDCQTERLIESLPGSCGPGGRNFVARQQAAA